MSDKREGKSFLVYRVFSGGFSVTKVKCYVSVQVTYLLDVLCKCSGNVLIGY